MTQTVSRRAHHRHHYYHCQENTRETEVLRLRAGTAGRILRDGVRLIGPESCFISQILKAFLAI